MGGVRVVMWGGVRVVKRGVWESPLINKQQKKKQQIFFDNTHIITISIRRLYLYEFYIYDLFKNRYKTLINRNKNIKFKKKIMSK